MVTACWDCAPCSYWGTQVCSNWRIHPPRRVLAILGEGKGEGSKGRQASGENMVHELGFSGIAGIPAGWC